ncbi:c2H2-type domain-containing protein [Nephila pilipes]|uniref:C2H2-type domain-containing protein n=1 Tax=Nephila pilipes TaxID=299642 RepID=A0A8X6PTB8_NEPPI|nr:c2H2-type domain-containing protein [Nephila pilipes]
MCDVEDNIKLSWILVSQFVSWDFCRYMCENGQNRNLEPDVLTFLRNMVVERTEKATDDVTKHEIIARFIMEIRTIQTASKLPLIHKLSKNVIEKCPELEKFVIELLHKLEWLLETLDGDKYPEMQEEILSRITCEVNKFNAEACKSLPLPKLLQVIQTWLHLQFQAQILEVKLRNVKNVELYEKVVDCLKKEKITSEEAKIIARVLYDDKKLEKIVLNIDAQTEADSQSQSLSTQSVQAPQQRSSSFQSSHLSDAMPTLIPEINPTNVTQTFSFDPNYSPPVPNNQKQKISLDESFNPSSPEELMEPVEHYKGTEATPNLGILNPTRPCSSESSGSKPKAQERATHEQISSINPRCSSDSDSSDLAPVTRLSKKKSRWKKFLKELDCEEDISDEEDVSMIKKHEKLKHALCEEILIDDPVVNIENNDSDTSDCDKDPEFRFLTPTMFKSDYVEQNPAPDVILLSDFESHNSSVVTNPTYSQDSDPLFIPRHAKAAFQDHLSKSPPKKRLKPQSKSPRQVKSQIKPSVKIFKDPLTPRQMTLRRFGFAVDGASNQNPIHQNIEETKKKFKLFNNDNICTRSSSDSSLFQKNSRSKKQNSNQKFENLGNKRRCEECKKTFKTPTELKKHVFIEHTVEDLSDE